MTIELGQCMKCGSSNVFWNTLEQTTGLVGLASFECLDCHNKGTFPAQFTKSNNTPLGLWLGLCLECEEEHELDIHTGLCEKCMKKALSTEATLVSEYNDISNTVSSLMREWEEAVEMGHHTDVVTDMIVESRERQNELLAEIKKGYLLK